MEKTDLFHNYTKIKDLKTDDKLKVRLLTVMMGASPDGWRVTGITTEALKIFRRNDFKYNAHMGIQRSHYPKSRKDFYSKMLKTDFKDCDEWWNYYHQHDKTILATSSENSTNKYSIIIDIDPSLGFFKNKFISWRHTKSERSIFVGSI